jgi:hypothetical protein
MIKSDEKQPVKTIGHTLILMGVLYLGAFFTNNIAGAVIGTVLGVPYGARAIVIGTIAGIILNAFV